MTKRYVRVSRLLVAELKSKTKIKAKLLSKGLTEDVDQLIDECDVEYDGLFWCKRFVRKAFDAWIRRYHPKELSKRFWEACKSWIRKLACSTICRSNDD